MLAIKYHVHIWQALPQLSCGGTGQIWCIYSSKYLFMIKNTAYGEIDERSFGNPHTGLHCHSVVPGAHIC